MEQLRDVEGRCQVVVNGIATDACGVFPCISLKNNGFDVWLSTDATGTTSDLAQRTSFDLLLQSGVKLTVWFMVACWCQKNWLDPCLNAAYAYPGNPTGAFEPLITIVRKRYPEYNALFISKYFPTGYPVTSSLPLNSVDPCNANLSGCCS